VIITTLCNGCLQPFEIQVSPDETHLIKELLNETQEMKCPRLCGGSILFSNNPDFLSMAKDVRLKETLRLTGKELYKAAMGFGLPDEIPMSKETVDAMLTSSPVIGVETEQVGKNIYLHELRLANKTIIHLTSGQQGSQVLKITRC
jgi:hypothetical protein